MTETWKGEEAPRQFDMHGHHDLPPAETPAGPPEFAFSWPVIPFAMMFPFLFMWVIPGYQWARWAALALLFVSFALCPLRDALLPRFCGHPEGMPCAWCGKERP